MFIRNCPKCCSEISYQLKKKMRHAERMGTLCPSCRQKGRILSEETKSKIAAARVGKGTKGINQGSKWKERVLIKNGPEKGEEILKKHAMASRERNGMAGRSFYSVWLNKYGEEEADRRLLAYKENFKTRASVTPNPMLGRSFYSVWIDKYGKEEADRRLSEFKAKQRANTSGERNPMYGKPSPRGSGRGWSGWYRGNYFRSLLELSFMLLCDESGKSWESAEGLLSVPYCFEGTDRTYRPDFYSEGTWVEIKPVRDLLKPSNLAKWAAIRSLYSDFEVLTERELPPITHEGLSKLVASGLVHLTDKWAKRLRDTM